MLIGNTKPTKFTDAKPGSTIRVTDTEGSFDPFEALVLEMKPEYGSNQVPALILKPDYQDEQIIVSATGRYKIDILLNSGALSQTQPSEHTVRFTSKPSEIEAIQFVGGVDSATEIIKHFAGKGVISWQQADVEHAESLLVHTGTGVARADIGVWVAEGAPGDVYPIPADVMALKYDQI